MGHWVVMRNIISDVSIFACAFIGVNAPSLIFYQQQEIIIRHFTFTDHSLKMSLAELDGETFQDQTLLTLSMNFFH